MKLVRVGLVTLAAVALFVFWITRSSDQRRIERRLGTLQDLVAKNGEESQLVGLNRARQIVGLFAANFEVRAEQLRFSTRDRRELTGFIHSYRNGRDRVTMRTSTESLSIGEANRRATQHVEFRFTGGGPLGASSERYRVQINWVEQENEWRIDYIDLIEILEGDALAF